MDEIKIAPVMRICYHGKAKISKQRLNKNGKTRMVVVVDCECGYNDMMILSPIPWNGLTVIKKRI